VPSRGGVGCRCSRFFVGCPRCGKGASLAPPGPGLPDGGGRLRRQRSEPRLARAAKCPEPSPVDSSAGPASFGSSGAEQTVEVVRNHEGGTCGACGSELPRAVFATGFHALKGVRVLKAGWSGRATVMSAAGHERTNPRRDGLFRLARERRGRS
jgi:hypothetical protein